MKSRDRSGTNPLNVWNITLRALIAPNRFPWCWTLQFDVKLMSKIVKSVANPLS